MIEFMWFYNLGETFDVYYLNTKTEINRITFQKSEMWKEDYAKLDVCQIIEVLQNVVSILFLFYVDISLKCCQWNK